MILDATAGNRTMWQHKNSANIIYIDIQKKLAVKPTIFADNMQTPFKDKIFDTIFYDPPHDYGSKQGYQPEYWSEKKQYAQKHVPFAFTYYGWDKYKTWQSLLRHIYFAQKELARILKDNGLLFFKWCEITKNIDRVLSLFDNWTVLMRIYVTSPTHTAGIKQTYWIVMQKKEKVAQETDLLQFQLSNNNTHVSL